MKPTTKEMIKFLSDLVSYLKKLDKIGISSEIDLHLNVTNTGIAEAPTDKLYKEYVNLGGKYIDIKATIDIPNYKSMLKEMRKIS